MKKLLIVLLIIIVSGAALYQMRIPHLLLGIYLSPSDKITEADAILVVSGDSDRMQHVIDLYRQDIAPKIIISGAAKEGNISNALAMHLEASQAGIPNQAVIMEEKATNTYENAVFTKRLVEKNGFRNIILVSSPYHQRRVYETFKSVFQDSGVRLQNSPSPYSRWKVNSWWTSDYAKSLTLSETSKIVWTMLTGEYE